VKKYIGAYTAVLSGLDALIFSGGIGEHAAAIRARICKDMAFAGIELDGGENEKHAVIISAKQSRVKVFVIPTDEERMIAQEAAAIYEKDAQL